MKLEQHNSPGRGGLARPQALVAWVLFALTQMRTAGLHNSPGEGRPWVTRVSVVPGESLRPLCSALWGLGGLTWDPVDGAIWGEHGSEGSCPGEE